MGRSQRHKVYIQDKASDGRPRANDAYAGGDEVRPTLNSITPNTAVKGSADLTLSCNGTQFTPNTVIWFNGGYEPTTYVSPTQVTTIVKPSLVSQAIAVQVNVSNGANPSPTPKTFTFT